MNNASVLETLLKNQGADLKAEQSNNYGTITFSSVRPAV